MGSLTKEQINSLERLVYETIFPSIEGDILTLSKDGDKEVMLRESVQFIYDKMNTVLDIESCIKAQETHVEVLKDERKELRDQMKKDLLGLIYLCCEDGISSERVDEMYNLLIELNPNTSQEGDEDIKFDLTRYIMEMRRYGFRDTYFPEELLKLLLQE